LRMDAKDEPGEVIDLRLFAELVASVELLDDVAERAARRGGRLELANSVEAVAVGLLGIVELLRLDER
jgi:hypothetical protein